MLNARPNLNGNTPEHFIEAAKTVNATRAALEAALRELRANVTHGRNYQHCASATDAACGREDDEAKIKSLQVAYNTCQQLVDELISAGKG